MLCELFRHWWHPVRTLVWTHKMLQVFSCGNSLSDFTFQSKCNLVSQDMVFVGSTVVMLLKYKSIWTTRLAQSTLESLFFGRNVCASTNVTEDNFNISCLLRTRCNGSNIAGHVQTSLVSWTWWSLGKLEIHTPGKFSSDCHATVQRWAGYSSAAGTFPAGGYQESLSCSVANVSAKSCSVLLCVCFSTVSSSSVIFVDSRRGFCMDLTSWLLKALVSKLPALRTIAMVGLCSVLWSLQSSDPQSPSIVRAVSICRHGCSCWLFCAADAERESIYSWPGHLPFLKRIIWRISSSCGGSQPCQSSRWWWQG